MLNRHDLVKQFELVVQQEIINHNNEISQSNQHINSLESKLEDFKEYQRSVNANLGSNASQMNQKIFDLTDSLLKVSQGLSSFIQEQRKIQEKNNQRDLVLSDFTCSTLDRFNHIDKEIIDLKKEISKMKILVDRTVAECKSEINISLNNFLSTIYKFKDEILNAPSDSEIIKKELDEKIDEYRIDAKGLLRDLYHLKKALHISEKKIENLYTLVERQKAKS